MEEFNTSNYEHRRKDDNTIVRVFGNGSEEPEMTQDFHQYQIDTHNQIVANSQAQLDKLKAFELENPPHEIEEETTEESENVG